MNQALLTVAGMCKSFPGVQALTDVDFDVLPGQVHALLGENGAGKSTLARIIAGLETPTSGRMLLSGVPYRPNGRKDAQLHGMRIVMQELHLVSSLTIAENIFIDKLPNILGFVSYAKLNRSAREIMQLVGLGHIDPATPIRQLGVGQQQLVEIAAGLSRSCRLIVLDEPTASLTDTETELLFAQIGRLKVAGVGIIYISHRLEEIKLIADCITVLRDGKLVAARLANSVTADEIIQMMIGRTLEQEHLRESSVKGPVALRVVDLSVGDKVKNVNFEVHKGELFGIAGLMGSGRTEMARALFGADRADSGSIFLNGSTQPAAISTPRDAVRSGIALLTEDRKEQGLLLNLPISMNISLTRLSRVSRLGWISFAAENAVADKYVHSLSVRCSSVHQKVGQLSGGNQQKVVIAKWLFRDSDILIFDEPTRGIDVGAKFEIYHMLVKLAQQGKAIIVISSDLKELMAISDRIAVMSAGRLAAVFPRHQWSPEKIMSAAFSGYTGIQSAELKN